MLAFLNSFSSRAVVLAGAMVLGALSPALAKDSVYSRTTVVVYNKDFPSSEVVASHYTTQRSIPSGNMVGISCGQAEEITRREYQSMIEEPLREIFTKKEWWTVKDLGNSKRVMSNKMHVIVLAHGIPLKIKDSRPPNAGASQTGKTQSNAASVDSELALIGKFNDRLSGRIPNPYFQKQVAFGDAGLKDLMLVGRVDGPDLKSCRRMIDDASDVERNGLWGRAYIDLAQKTNGGYKQGEDWLTNIVAQCERDGIATVVDSNSGTFPSHYPMTDAALYFGWYTRNANGPFSNPEFQLKKGAVACHIHSYSGITLRSNTAEWVGPMVKHGAAGVLGNVYEPFLDGTTHLDIFVRRLLDGYTMIEAAYMATPYLSWMSIVVGDPLYRPFDGFRTYEPQFYRKDENLHAKTYHVATKLWSKKESAYEEKLSNATKLHKTGFYHEAMAARARTAGSINEAGNLLLKAKKVYFDPKDRLRVDLQLVDLERQRNNKGKARELLREMNKEPDYKDLPEKAAIKALLNQLDPPGPSGS